MLSPCTTCGTPAPTAGCPHCASQTAAKALGSAALLLGLTACLGNEPRQNESAIEADYGVPDTGFLDADSDGYGVSQDCDDENDQIYPGAPETAGDGVDSNCNGEDDT